MQMVQMVISLHNQHFDTHTVTPTKTQTSTPTPEFNAAEATVSSGRLISGDHKQQQLQTTKFDFSVFHLWTLLLVSVH